MNRNNQSFSSNYERRDVKSSLSQQEYIHGQDKNFSIAQRAGVGESGNVDGKIYSQTGNYEHHGVRRDPRDGSHNKRNNFRHQSNYSGREMRHSPREFRGGNNRGKLN